MISDNGFVRRKLEELSSLNFRMGVNGAEAAVQAARDQFLSSHVPVGGQWMPKRRIPEGFPIVFNEFMKRKETSARENGIEWPDGGYVPLLVRETGLTGAFYLVERNNPFNYVESSDGEPVVVYPAELMKDMAAATEQERRDAQAEAFAEAERKRELDQLSRNRGVR